MEKSSPGYIFDSDFLGGFARILVDGLWGAYKLTLILMQEILSKMNQKTVIAILVGVIIILVGVVLWQLGGAKNMEIEGTEITDTATTTDSVATTTKATTTTKPKPAYTAPVVKSGYVSISYKTPKEAVFVISTPVLDADVTGDHIDYCLFISGVSKVNDYCEDTAYGSGFKIVYSAKTGVVRISDTSGDSRYEKDLTKGAFLPTCSGCTASVRFHGIRNEAGVVLPTVQIPVTIK